jgi:hypothetical protein
MWTPDGNLNLKNPVACVEKWHDGFNMSNIAICKL